MVVVVVVVVAQPDCLPMLVRMPQASEPRSHRSLPKHLPLHTEESLEKIQPVYNSVFTTQSLAA